MLTFKGIRHAQAVTQCTHALFLMLLHGHLLKADNTAAFL